ncbi:MAG: MerR family transcriptional regulator [Pseudonocardiaceae bacterium]
MVTLRDMRRLRRRVCIGSPDPWLTSVSGMAAVTELVHQLGMIKLLDAAIEAVKTRDRGVSGGQHGNGHPTQPCGDHRAAHRGDALTPRITALDLECAQSFTVTFMTAATERIRELVNSCDAADLPPLSVELVRTLDLPADLPTELAISQVVEATGVSAHTLRYYERIGLVEVGRDAGGRRVYDREALARVVFVNRLRSSDMPIRDIARYLALVRQGETSVPARLALMQAHRESIQRRLRNLQTSLTVIDYKIATYGGVYPRSAG